MKIKTPVDKIEVELKDFITGREARDIQNVLLSGVKMAEEIKDLDPLVLAKSQDKTIEIVVKSVNGKSDDVINAILDMHKNDTEFVMSKINEITNGGTEEKKTKI